MKSPSMYANVPFPDHNINPELKGGEWLLKCSKAAWGDSYGQQIFYHARERYAEYRDYAYGRQSVDRYKPALGIDQAQDASPYNITFENRPVISKYMDIILSIMMGVQRKAIATPIDVMAKDEADKYFANARAKILMKKALAEVNPRLANSPMLMQSPGEPEDFDELEMQMDYGFKFNMAMEAEQGIELVQYQNNFPQKRQQVCKDLKHLGVGGYKDWLDENYDPKFRACDPSAVIISWCRFADFSDKIYVGEVTEPTVAELSQYFNEDQLKEAIANAQDNTIFIDRPYSNKENKLKLPVLDLEVKTWNDIVFSRNINDEGNEVYKTRDYENIANPERVKEKSNIYDVSTRSYKSKYFSKKTECWYKICWVIGTDLYYNYGKVENQKRPKTKKHISESSYHFQAVNFHNMTAQGLVERLKPIVDEYQLTIYKIQDFKNKWLPYVMEIDMDALEAVAYGAAGTKWTPEKILELVFQSRALVVRKKDIAGINVNYKAMEIHPTGMAAEMIPLMNDLSRLLQEMNDVTGLNPVTDGSGADERKLKAVAELEARATNNAIAPLMFAEKMLFESLSKGCIRRLVQAVKQGHVEGVLHALGGNTVKFIQASPDLSLWDWGIQIQDVPSEQDYKFLLEQMGVAEQQGLFRPQDVLMIKQSTNLKQMEMRIGSLYEKRYKEAEANKRQMVQMQTDGNTQIAVVSETAKQKTIGVQLQADLVRLQVENEWKYRIEAMKKKSDFDGEVVQSEARNVGASIQAQAKIDAQALASHADLLKTHIAGEKAIEKQKISNQKPAAKS